MKTSCQFFRSISRNTPSKNPGVEEPPRSVERVRRASSLETPVLGSPGPVAAPSLPLTQPGTPRGGEGGRGGAAVPYYTPSPTPRDAYPSPLGQFQIELSSFPSFLPSFLHFFLPSFLSSFFSSFFPFFLPSSVADPDPGSGIGCLFDPWIRDPGWEKVSIRIRDPGSGMNNPDHIF